MPARPQPPDRGGYLAWLTRTFGHVENWPSVTPTHADLLAAVASSDWGMRERDAQLDSEGDRTELLDRPTTGSGQGSTS